ncbi:MAG: glutamine synthetase family protein [Colwellia sp.]|nr:glutamine synthetase family protein [Colwellia sp.]MCW8864812.1 glutamine synthetase family protein [Colwellia sp.]MCW9081027.1 glutamine synthetase family protein [Colwellia sp.]
MNQIVKWLEENKVKQVQCLIGDHTGVARGKVLPVEKFISEQGCRLGETILLQSIVGGYAADGVLWSLSDPRDVDMILKPDANACYLLPWHDEKTAMIIHDCYTPQGEKVTFSPRNLLRKVIQLYAEQGWQAVVAPEMELYLAKTSTDENQELQAPAGKSGRVEAGRQSFGIDAISEFDPLMKDIYAWANAQGLGLDVVVHEEGRGQFEFNFDHGDPLMLADQVFTFKRTVKAAAEKHGITATFMAKPICGQPGSAMHIHQSIVDTSTGNNIFADEHSESGFSEQFSHYLGGLQRFIPQVMPMFAPNVNSYRRFLTGESVPVNLHWGIENRTVGLRVPDAPSAAKRVENRIAGADANPYLAIAATLICGYIGMMEGLEPSAETTSRANGKLSDNLPLNIDLAIELMSGSETIKKYLGEEFVRGFIGTRQADYDHYKSEISAWERRFLLTNV